MAGLFFHILGIMIPTDALIFFRGVGIPPTRSYMIIYGDVLQNSANDLLDF